jgi:imidazolonepropionase-like amidohydrolase
MATQADVRRIVLSLPATEQVSGRFAFAVRRKGKLKEFVWVWMERVTPKTARVADPRVIAARTASVEDRARRRAAAEALAKPSMRLFEILLLTVALTSPRLSAQTLTITNATVIDVSNGALHRDQTIVVDGNRIVNVGAPPAPVAARGRVVDAKGMYVIPGLWDMHTHAYFGWNRDFGDSYVLPLFIANGVTGIRDMGSDLDAVLRARTAVAAHRLVGPRMVVSGPMLDGPKATFAASIPVATPEDGRKAVRMLKRRGADFIKIQSGVPRQAYFAIADEAKKRGTTFEGHVPDAIRASEAIAAGQRTFEHLIGIFEASTPDEDTFLTRRYGAGQEPSANKSLAAFLDRYDPAREKIIVERLAANRVWQCPTLFWERGQWLVDVIDYLKDPDIAFTPRTWIEEKYPSSQKAILETMDADPLEVRRRFVDHELAVVRTLHAAGVPFLAGTDTPAGVGVTPGISLHLELQRFVAAGLTPLEALQTATINPARFLGRLSDHGSVLAGRLADLVILRANPLVDIANTRTIVGVVADGTYRSQADIESLQARVKQTAARQ